MTIPPFDPHTHTNRNHPETSFEAAESMIDTAPKNERKLLWGWYDLGWEGGNYKEATEAAARRWPDMDRDKSSPRATDCKQHGLIDPVLDQNGNQRKRDKAFLWRISREGCAVLDVPYPFTSCPAPPPSRQQQLDLLLCCYAEAARSGFGLTDEEALMVVGFDMTDDGCSDLRREKLIEQQVFLGSGVERLNERTGKMRMVCTITNAGIDRLIELGML